MIGKLQASARQAHVNLSEGSVVWLQSSARQVLVNLSEGWVAGLRGVVNFAVYFDV